MSGAHFPIGGDGYQPPQDERIVFTSPRRKECLECRLVLTAVGIDSEAVHRDGRWHLVVDRSDAERAAVELESYRRENPDQPAPAPPPRPVPPGAMVGVFVYAAVLLIVAAAAGRSAWGVDWFAVGRMHAGSVLAGQWWRTVTALTLHLDAGHLVSNLVFGGVFGLLIGHVYGGGVSWLAIVAAGTAGNCLNAFIQPPEHASIGASTAVFGALGLLIPHALSLRRTADETPLRRWSPLIAGLVLLGMIGIGGERTDVAAHVTGLIAGLGIGRLLIRLPDRLLVRVEVQQYAGLAAVALVLAAWAVAPGLAVR